MFDCQLNRTNDGLHRVRAQRLAGVARLALALALVLSWSTAAFATKPPPHRKAKGEPRVKARTAPVTPPKSVTRVHRNPEKGESRAKAALAEPVKIPGPGEPRPVIECKEPVKDFGTVWVGPVLKHEFTLTNNGKAPLRITKVRPSCGCTIAGTYPKVIKPGESGKFPFSVHSTKLRGKFEKGITIKSNDPATPNFRLRLRGQVKRYIELTPTAINFGKLFGGEAMEKVIKIRSNIDEPIEVELGSKLKTDIFTAEIVATEPGKAYELRVRAEPPYKPGTLREILLLHTNNENQKRISVNIRANIPKRLDVSPAVLTLRKRLTTGKAAAAQTTRVVKFSNYGAKPVVVLDATVNDSAIKVNVQEQKAGKQYAVQVEFPIGYQAPPTGRMLTLKTNDPETPTIEVPIRGLGARTKAKPKERQKRPAEAMVDTPVPAFAATTTDGKPFATAALAGGVTVLDFFAVNCGYCGKQIPRLEAIRKEYAGKGVRFVAVAQTMRNKKYSQQDVTDKLKSLGFRGETVYDPGNKIGPQFKATSYPTMVVLGKKGKIDAVNIGNMGDLEKRLKGQLDALLAGKRVPKVAAATKKTPDQKPKQARKSPTDLVGTKAAAFSFKTLDGKEFNNAELAKAPATVLNIVATNCGYCKKQIPRIEKLREKYEAKGVRFVNVVATMRKKFETAEVVKTLEGIGSHLAIAHDADNKIPGLFNARGFPSMVVLGKSGKIEAANVGNLGDLETRLSAQLDAMIAGKPVPKFADAKKPQKPKQQAARADSLVGKPAPAFAFKTLDGKDVSNAELAKSSATVLNFVAPNCGFCKKQVPRLEKIRQKYAEKGVRFVNVAQTMRKKYETAEVVKVFGDLGTNIELAHDPDNKSGTAFKARGFPTMVVVGKDGKVAAANIGNLGDLEKRLEAQLDAVIAGKPIPAFAKSQPKKQQRKRPAMDLVNKPAPSFALKTIEGKDLSSADFANHPATVLNFVAPNCGFCKRQLPGVEAVRKEYQAKGVRFVNVVQKMRKDFTLDEVKGVLEKAGSNLEIVMDDFASGKVGKEGFKAVSYPTLVVVDKTGKISHVNIGAKKDLEQLLKGQLDALIK